ncbi:MAG: serine hydrolase domain-containing protein, partial [Gemmatimonadaceae bacterium]
VMVRDGQVVFRKGYGVADVATGRPVSPDSTLFAVGSLSKLVTATAVLQLRDEGRLDLHADVNGYLSRFTLRDTYREPVTLWHLLTHTAGFDRRYIGTAAPSAEEIMPLDEFLAARMPPRVRPPGELYVYSDYGMTLAGHLVSLRSGMPFARYARERVLAPLGMSHSSFEPDALEHARCAAGYHYADGKYTPRTRAFVNVSPAGALVTTVSDMGKFLIAQLQYGIHGSARILEDSSAREMQRRQFAHHPRLPGVAYAYHEDLYYGQRALRHDGWMSGVASLVYLVPERNTGFFAVFTGDGEDEMVWQLIRFVHEYGHPVARPTAPERSPAGFERRARRFVGSYRKLQYAERGIEHSANVMLAARVSVTDNGDGTLALDRPAGRVRLVEVGPGLFQWSDGYGHVAFQQDAGGDARRLFMHQEIYERIPWYQTPGFLRRAAIFFLLVFITAPFVWMTAGFVRRYRRKPAPQRAARWALALGALLCALNVAFVVGMVPAFATTSVQQLALGLPPTIATLLELPQVTAVLALVLLAWSVVAWRRSFWSVPTRLHYALVTLVALAYVPFLVSLGLLSVPFSERGGAVAVTRARPAMSQGAGVSTGVSPPVEKAKGG